jgi:hypothetical protein
MQKELGLDLLPRRKFIQSRSGYSTLLSYGVVRTLSSMWAGGRSPSNPVDIFHATYYRPTYYESRKSKKLAITVHDFIPEKLGWLGIRNPHIGKKALAKKAYAKTKKELQDLRQKVSKENLKKGKETFKYPMKPKELSIPKIPEIPKLPPIPKIPEIPKISLPTIPKLPL